MENIKSQLKTISDLDKSTWSVVRFGDVAIQQKESVDRGNTNLTLYVAGDHMRTNDLHIRQWGEFDGSYVGPAFHRKFEKGDILYGSRRTYLRKVAVADFDGITANTTYVMKANIELIEPALLPFILLSESFAQHSIQNSKGSTNPYINWKDIDWYEFKLPPREMQKKLADLLWAVDEVKEKYLITEKTLKDTYSAYVESLFDTKAGLKLRRLGDVAKINASSLSQKTRDDFEFYYLDIASILGPKKVGNLERYSFKEAPSRARRNVNNGNIVLSLVRPYYKAFVLIEDAHEIIASTGTGVIETNELLLHNKFLFHQFFSKRFELYCEEKMTGTNYPAITPRDLKEYMIFVSESIEDQKEVAKKLDALDSSIETNNKNKLAISKLLFSLINSIF